VSRFEVSEQPDPACWDASVCAVGGTVFHSSAWAHYVVLERGNAVPQFFTLYGEGGAIVGVALGFRAQSGRALLGPISGRLWLDAVPAVLGGDPGTLRAFVRHLEEYASAAGAVELAVGSFAYQAGPTRLKTLDSNCGAGLSSSSPSIPRRRRCGALSSTSVARTSRRACDSM